MPEGNEIHRWAERHSEAFAGRKLNVFPGPTHRFHDAHRVDGRKLNRVYAVGKHLGYEFGDDLILHVHLGRFGDWREGAGPLPEPKGALRAVLQRAGKPARQPAGTSGDPSHRHYLQDDGTQPFPAAGVEWCELRGPTDCSVYSRDKWEALVARLGPDPLGADPKGHDHPKKFIEAALASKKPIAELLMDQDVVSGIGNIYRAELLFRHRVNPFQAGSGMRAEQLRAIWRDATPLLRAGMVDRRIVCTRKSDRPSRKEPAARGEEHYVYRRRGKACFVCGAPVLHRDLAGRTLYWCPTCQGTSAEQNAEAWEDGVSLRTSRARLKARKAGVLD